MPALSQVRWCGGGGNWSVSVMTDRASGGLDAPWPLGVAAGRVIAANAALLGRPVPLNWPGGSAARSSARVAARLGVAGPSAGRLACPCCAALPSAVKQRMKSVASIQKITKAMKMVAASKMRSAQLATEQSRGARAGAGPARSLGALRRGLLSSCAGLITSVRRSAQSGPEPGGGRHSRTNAPRRHRDAHGQDARRPARR